MSIDLHRHGSRIAMALFLALAGSGLALAAMSPAQKAIHDNLAAAARAGDPAFKEFSIERGKTFFAATHQGGKPATPSCTTCHTADPKKAGSTRAGKVIDPMAASVNPRRFTDEKEVDKWYRRNCTDVLGRECTALEKGDVMVYLLSL